MHVPSVCFPRTQVFYRVSAPNSSGEGPDPRAKRRAPGWYSLHDRVLAGGEVILGAVDEGHSEVEEQVDKQGPSILGEEDLKGRARCEHRGVPMGSRALSGRPVSLLTITQLICAPRSRKYSVAVVPTGRFCSTSSSFRDFPSGRRAETQRGQWAEGVQPGRRCNMLTLASVPWQRARVIPAP